MDGFKSNENLHILFVSILDISGGADSLQAGDVLIFQRTLQVRPAQHLRVVQRVPGGHGLLADLLGGGQVHCGRATAPLPRHVRAQGGRHLHHRGVSTFIHFTILIRTSIHFSFLIETSIHSFNCSHKDIYSFHDYSHEAIQSFYYSHKDDYLLSILNNIHIFLCV